MRRVRMPATQAMAVLGWLCGCSASGAPARADLDLPTPDLPTPDPRTHSAARASAAATPGDAARGVIRGIVRDADSGAPLGFAVVVVEPAADDGSPGCPGMPASRPSRTEHPNARNRAETTDERGEYRIDGLPAGRYRVTGYYADRTVQFASVAVNGGQVAAIDIEFDPRAPDHVYIGQDFGPRRRPESSRRLEPGSSVGHAYAVEQATHRTGQIAGTVVDAESGRHMTGAVVAATTPVLHDAQLVVVGEDGGFRIPQLPPSTYVVTVYYHLIGRGSIEVRRSRVVVTAGHVTPLDLRLDLRVDR